MIPKRFKAVYKYTARLRKYNNIVEAAHLAVLARIVTGTLVFKPHSLPGNRIVARFSVSGFMFMLLWISIYLYCAYTTFDEDQTILRMLYNTKLKRYGDDVERISSILYFLISMILTSIRMTRSYSTIQEVVDIDSMIEKAGCIVNHNKIARLSLTVYISQVVVYFTRLFCTYLTLNISIVIPMQKMYQVVLSDNVAIITTSIYCYRLIILRDRFKWIHKTLREIEQRNSWEHKVFVRGKLPPNMTKVVELQDRRVCEKIKLCARIHSKLYNTCLGVNKLFGLSLLLTLLYYTIYIILYLFYFMEATAAGLFHDANRYFTFLVYIFWQIAIALGSIFLIVGFSESTMDNATKISHIVNKIINEDFSPAINQEAMQFSIQLLHETPVFNVCGFFHLNFQFFYQGARSVSTYLVMLLQFVTEKTPSTL